jgi:hypothetical protein
MIVSVEWVDPTMVARAKHWRISCRIQLKVPKATFSLGDTCHSLYNCVFDVPAAISLLDETNVMITKVTRDSQDHVLCNESWYDHDTRYLDEMIDDFLAKIS